MLDLVIAVYVVEAIIFCSFSLIMLGYRNKVFSFKPNKKGLIPFVTWIGLSIGVGVLWPLFILYASVLTLYMLRDFYLGEDLQEDR